MLAHRGGDRNGRSGRPGPRPSPGNSGWSNRFRRRSGRASVGLTRRW